jgi:hypothetical protein
MFGRTHQGAAFFELLPGWLRFLQKLGLLDAPRRERTIAELRPLVVELEPIFEHENDALLVEGLKQWDVLA